MGIVISPIGEAYYLMPFGYDQTKLHQTAISGTEFINVRVADLAMYAREVVPRRTCDRIYSNEF
ncbi:hypothetical protein [Fortiea sp. LEGE XX443]|uniref:hypothetical protein n=1 Tax=Fortiea sp. LEGE XX443 TaxID=1828611 RepID=UPI001D1552DA|nr:hypothetical protein [Fortiea sp. LEGE XX443]